MGGSLTTSRLEAGCGNAKEGIEKEAQRSIESLDTDVLGQTNGASFPRLYRTIMRLGCRELSMPAADTADAPPPRAVVERAGLGSPPQADPLRAGLAPGQPPTCPARHQEWRHHDGQRDRCAVDQGRRHVGPRLRLRGLCRRRVAQRWLAGGFVEVGSAPHGTASLRLRPKQEGGQRGRE